MIISLFSPPYPKFRPVSCFTSPCSSFFYRHISDYFPVFLPLPHTTRTPAPIEVHIPCFPSVARLSSVIFYAPYSYFYHSPVNPILLHTTRTFN